MGSQSKEHAQFGQCASVSVKLLTIAYRETLRNLCPIDWPLAQHRGHHTSSNFEAFSSCLIKAPFPVDFSIRYRGIFHYATTAWLVALVRSEILRRHLSITVLIRQCIVVIKRDCVNTGVPIWLLPLLGEGICSPVMCSFLDREMIINESKLFPVEGSLARSDNMENGFRLQGTGCINCFAASHEILPWISWYTLLWALLINLR